MMAMFTSRPTMISLVVLLLTTTQHSASGFSVLTPAVSTTTATRQSHVVLSAAAKEKRASIPDYAAMPKKAAHPEYAVEEEDDDEDEFSVPLEEAPVLATISEDDDDEEEEYETIPEGVESEAPLELSSSTSSPANEVATTIPKIKVQYAAMEPGTVVQIQVGDVSRARKAWKKRRRTGSPLLVPCSVLNVDLSSTVRWNLIYLLEKFGDSSVKGIRISMSELSRRHRTHLKASLQQHAVALGYGDAQALVEGLFHKQVQDAYGVKLIIEENDDEESTSRSKLFLETPLSRVRAQTRANQAAILQFCEQPQESDTLQHTGIVRNRRTAEATSETMKNLYQLKPLSAALRVSQQDVEQGIIQNGSLHAAVVFDYDAAGDAGVAPLLTLSLNPQRNQVRDRLKSKFNHKTAANSMTGTPAFMLKELTVGDGPIQGKVVKLVKGGAWIDCGVGRPTAATSEKGAVIPVYGVLRFKDAVLNSDDSQTITAEEFVDDEIEMEEEDDDEDWDEILSIDDLDLDDEEDDVDDGSSAEETTDALLDDDDKAVEDDGLSEFDTDPEFADSEDITHLFLQNEDGSLTYTDPETGEESIIDLSSDDDDDGHSEVDTHDEEHADKDITHLFLQNEDGSLTYKDPETGEPKIMHLPVDDDDEEEESVENEDLPVRSESFMAKRFPPTASRSSPTGNSPYRTKTLRAGDRIEVFVKSVSKQSSQLMLTMDSSIQGMKAKDLKKESDVNKKLSRLAKKLGGFQRIRELRGMQCDGVVKATSDTGDWLYVQPDMDGLPVGVATVSDEITDELHQGDSVRIQIDGVDEDRGQLAISILKKLSP